MMRHCKPRSRPTQAGRALRALHMQQQAHLMATAQLLSSLVTQRATLESNRCLCCGEAAVACEVSGCSRRPKAVLLPSQHGFCDTFCFGCAAHLQDQVRTAASTAREPQQQLSSMRSAEKAWHRYLLRVDRGIRLEPITLFALTTADAYVTMLPAAQQAQCTKELLVRHGRVLHDGWTREDNLSG